MITIEKAIEVLTQQVRYYHQIHQVDIIDSLNLAIEALKREEKRRRFAIPDKVDWLPGETKE